MEDRLLNTSLVRQRPPHWRYLQAAADAAECKFRLPAAADLPLRTLTDFLRRLHYGDPAARRRAALAPPQFRRCSAALEIFGDREAACELEARVLARQTPREIATRLSLPVGCVQFYEDCFYDVRPEIRNREYIVRSAIRPERERGDAETARHRAAMKVAGYFCGTLGLEELFFGDRRALEYWCSPGDCLTQLAARNAFESLADELLSSTTSPDWQAWTARLDAARALINSVCSGNYPTSEVIYRTRGGAAAM